MVNQNKIFSFKIKYQAKIVFLSDVEKTVDKTLYFNQKVFIFFVYLFENICCGYSLELPYWGASNEYVQHVFMEK